MISSSEVAERMKFSVVNLRWFGVVEGVCGEILLAVNVVESAAQAGSSCCALHGDSTGNSSAAVQAHCQQGAFRNLSP